MKPEAIADMTAEEFLDVEACIMRLRYELEATRKKMFDAWMDCCNARCVTKVAEGSAEARRLEAVASVQADMLGGCVREFRARVYELNNKIEGVLHV